MDRREPANYAEAEHQARRYGALATAVRVGMTIVVLIYVGLVYSLCYVSRDSAEFYVCVMTLIMNTLLFAGMATAAVFLARKRRRCQELMKEFEQKDEPDPWIV